jgi:hypothetical protein
MSYYQNQKNNLLKHPTSSAKIIKYQILQIGDIPIKLIFFYEKYNCVVESGFFYVLNILGLK